MIRICKSIQQCMLKSVSWLTGKPRANNTSRQPGLLPGTDAIHAERNGKNREPAAGKKYGH
ncbi:hypothetical protein EGT74_03310 [Chitinophaga lutea]|uniref:Uncharacterized protein n=1 Tax=Chitinophaga lutea TaxID=2488634 RepID=A0A3N4PVE4_9BACT|nr:hypothetical protein [Chitinophaga lutea]RPE12592.1 hypothetical protein EGT74_03310 [Chitinophaga lutea]